MNYLSPIEPHCHLRSVLDYPDYEFAAMALIDAKAVGLAALIEMPNCTPPLTTTQVLNDRRAHLNKIAESMGCQEVQHFIHVGITDDIAQVRRALEAIQFRIDQFDSNGYDVRDGLPIADKTFYVHSTNRTGILDEETQKEIWRIKGKMGYTGVSIGHFEDEKHYGCAFNYLDPISHSERQGIGAEVAQVEKQLGFAQNAKFKGTFYIAHVSAPDTVRFVQEFRKIMQPEFKIVMEATWHHLFLNWSDYVVHGNCVKCNPPLRSAGSQGQLLAMCLRGDLDIIGSDSAPHPYSRKLSPTPPSGIPALPFWTKGIELLTKLGMKREKLDDMTFYKARELFRLEIEPEVVDIKYQPELWTKYGWNPFSRIDK